MITVKALATYLVAAAAAWVPTKNHNFYETEEQTMARYMSIATDIATVVLKADEPPLFADDANRIKTGLLVTSVAAAESNFVDKIDDGRTLGDHGTAYCLMQIRPIRGIFLDGVNYGFAVHKSKEWRSEHASAIMIGNDLLTDRKTCVTVGLHMLRHDGVYAYVGEARGGARGKFRMARAKEWFTAHPFVESKEDDGTIAKDGD